MGYYIDIPFLANMCAWAYEYDIWDSVLILNSKIVLPDLKENISKDSLSKWLNSKILKIDFLLCPKTIIQKKKSINGTEFGICLREQCFYQGHLRPANISWKYMIENPTCLLRLSKTLPYSNVLQLDTELNQTVNI